MSELGTASALKSPRNALFSSSFPLGIASGASILVVGFVTLACVGLVMAPRFFEPIEDATIMFQYAENFARTGVISYIENGSRAEGGTDFLWLVLLAAARFCGVAPFAITGWVNAVSVIGIGFLLVKIGDLRMSATNVAIAALVPLASVQLWAAIAGFAVLPFGLILTFCVYAFVKQKDAMLAMAMLLLCLLRPDGIVFAAPLAAMRLLSVGLRPRILAYYIGFCAVPGIIYFIWRWRYFGELLPLPFLVKSDAARGFGPFAAGGLSEIRHNVEWCLPLILIFAGSGARVRLNFELFVGLIVVPSLFYASMRLDQNMADRFHFYFVIATAAFAALNWREVRIPRWALLAVIACSYALFIAPSWKTMALVELRDRSNNIGALAKELHADGLRGTIATTEAGRLVYYSQWPAYDLWGLNTEQFAHHLMQPGELTALNADLVEIQFSQNGGICQPNPAWKTPYRQRTWEHLAANAVQAMSGAPYSLWLVPPGGPVSATGIDPMTFQSPKEQTYLCFYIKDSYGDRDRLVEILKQHGAITADDYARQLGPAHGTFE